MLGNKCRHVDFWGRKGKEDPQQVPHDARTLTLKGEDDQECLFDFGRERSTTRIEGQQLHLHESPWEEKWLNHTKSRAKETGETLTRQRPEKTEERKCKRAREKERNRAREELGLESWVKGWRGGLSCWSCAYDCDSCHISSRRNQSAPAACRSCTQPLLRTGPALSDAHTEPKKTCSRLRGFCRSAVMKREFVQPRAPGKQRFYSSIIKLKFTLW